MAAGPVVSMREAARNPALRARYNRELFTELAPGYDRVNRWMSFGRDAAWKRCMVRALPAAETPACVDLACGTGDVAFLLAARYLRGRVTGIDLTPAMIDVARERSRAPNVEFRVADLVATGLPSASADIVTGAYAIRLAAPVEAALAEAARLLRPGGTAAFLEFARPVSPAGWRLEMTLLRLWGATWGRLIHGRGGVYTYIPETLEHFPNRVQLRRMFAAAGFSDIRRRSCFFGVMDLWTLRRN